MAEPLGLRERKKRRTRQAISDAAIALFLESGFDRVPVAAVAAAAEVSKPTLFAYFPTKEDLVLHRIADHETEAARVVRARAAGESPLAALRRHLLDALDRRDPVTGLCDTPDVLAFQRLLYSTPALLARLPAYTLRGEDELARALAEARATAPEPAPGATGRTGAPAPSGPGGAEDPTARIAAAQITATQRVLAARNSDEMRAGRSADAVHPEAVARAEAAFALLSDGLAPHLPPAPAPG
ncbi:TetR/AcrR family transcriptional regulator [Nocardiopsis trehalosi]|uniref:TetR/AcrR family transcriptional regulator n=1 Tax=Nocardiopsis trehalosi TaxID=109329 RepID=UPI000A03A7C5|nr:TetR family transcriptional regulator [Nocardiopsis trehalosi]